MKFTPTYICPKCNKIMKIEGTKCPYCKKEFSCQEIDNMYFVCPTCLSNEIKIVFSDPNNSPIMGVSIEGAKYTGIIEIAQTSVNAGMQISFKCNNCATHFDSEEFLLVSHLKD